mgnify:CR=1 FL=1
MGSTPVAETTRTGARVMAGKFGAYRNMTKVSGGQVARTTKKMCGCDNCNFMELHDKAIRPVPLKTSDECPKCKQLTIRIFDSQAEFSRAQELKMLQANGNISDLKYQVRFDLHTINVDGKKVKLFAYVTDFTYTEPCADTPEVDDFIVEDVKGNVVTEIAAIKMKMFEIEYGIPVRITKR